MTKVIAISNHKGGTGKTTTTLNLGRALSLHDKNVLIIDLDPQANLSQSLGVENPKASIYNTLMEAAAFPIYPIADNFQLVPSDLDLEQAVLALHLDINGFFKLRDKLNLIKNQYDYIFIDCPPSLASITVNAYIASDYILIPVEAQYLATKGLDTITTLMETIQSHHNPKLQLLGLVLTKTNRTTISNQITEWIGSNYGNKAFHTTIRQNVALVESTLNSESIFEYAPDSNGAKDYNNLAVEFLKWIENKNIIS